MSQNLDAKASEISFKIISKIGKLEKKKQTKQKNLIDKALGVLSDNGVYAYYVYIISQNDGTSTELFLDSMQEIFNIFRNIVEYNSENRSKYFQEISEHLSELLFLKQLLEKTLIYARYHAKALGD